MWICLFHTHICKGCNCTHLSSHNHHNLCPFLLLNAKISAPSPPLKTRLWLIIKRGGVQLQLQGGGECGGRVLYWLHKPISTWFLLLFTITYVPIVTIDVPISAYWLQSDKEQKRIVVGIFLLLSMTPIPYAANDSSSYNTTPIHSCVCNTIRP